MEKRPVFQRRTLFFRDSLLEIRHAFSSCEAEDPHERGAFLFSLRKTGIAKIRRAVKRVIPVPAFMVQGSNSRWT